MSERIHALAQHLLGKSSVEECSLEKLQHLTKRYPYFAPAQFLLLQKLKETGSPDAEAQQRKAVLYFHDPLQFDLFLSAESHVVDEDFAVEHLAEKEHSADETIATPAYSTSAESSENVAEEFEENDRRGILITEKKETAESETITVFPDPDTITEPFVEPANEPAVLPEEPPVATLTPQETQSNSEEESVREDVLVDGETDIAKDSSEQAPSLLGKLNVTIPAAGTDALFEPYHTVDYFASQGIKVTATDLPKDKLSKQLRSFTEWLKVMKRLPAAEMAGSPQSSAEKTVVNMATHSVEESEIVTEAMAEVWAKQGAHQKAIETYNKLSLLNPSKKTYFAAKIENLKGS
ncbi:hypothetical protein HRG84_11465 [Flavisolibacter sp. BT320]|nr:hypothetical protein [Flavisolibacter longurius]